ncbi:MAG: hypothetical protein HY255_01290 [Betaproteobacteria bacterium]|nr:hypothetical protein [Betaproteobacteria bacterium]
MDLAQSRFRRLLIASLVLGLVASLIDLVFPGAVPTAVREAQGDSFKDASTTFLVSSGVFGAIFAGLLVSSVYGLYRFRRWARPLALIVTALTAVANISTGVAVSSGWASAFDMIANTLWGMVLALSWCSPFREIFTGQADSRAAQDTAMPQASEQTAAEPDPAIELPVVATDNERPAIFANLIVGLRGALFLRIDENEIRPTWSQWVVLTALYVLAESLFDFWNTGLVGQFTTNGLPGILFIVPVLLFGAWTIARAAGRSERTLLLAVVFTAMAVTITIVCELVQLQTRAVHIGKLWGYGAYFGFYLFAVWLAASACVAAIRLLDMVRGPRWAAALLAAAFIGIPLAGVYRDASLWAPAYDASAADEGRRQWRMLNSEEVFYRQPQLLARDLAAVRPGREGDITMFFVGVAGYAEQDVFMKEVRYVSRLFRERYGTSEHSVLLINNAKSVTETPIASGSSLRLALNRVGDVMDRERDILFLYLTSHGSSDHKFSLSFGLMQFNDLGPAQLRKLLDESGIKRRVIVVSACYSGGFVEPLKSPDTLIMTASAADKTSFGCSNEAEFTYFGQAYFRDALGKTPSFIDAFDLARPAIEARETATENDHANPVIYVGANIRAALAEFERQRARGPAVAGG